MSGEHAYEARDLSRLADLHVELQGPEQPRFVEDLLCVPVGADAVYVVGGDPHVIRGAGVPWLFEELVPLVDGTRTVADLEKAFPHVAADALRDAIALMHMHGMVVEADEDQRPGCPATDEARIFFTRYLRRTGRHRTGASVQQALERAHVCITGDQGARAALESSLRHLRIGRVDVAPDVSSAAAIGANLAVVLARADALEDAARCCLAAGVPLLLVDLDTWTIGPLTIPRASACYVCMRLQIHPVEAPRPMAHPALDALWTRAIVARVAQHVVAFATGLVQPVPIEHVEVWRPSEGKTTLHRFITRLPHCPLCGREAGPRTMTLVSGHRESRARLFHSRASVQPWHLQQPASMQQHLAPHVRRLQAALTNVPKQDTSCEVTRCDIAAVAKPLSRGAGVALSPVATRVAASPVDVHTLGALLFYSFGGRVGRHANQIGALRLHTASGGNLATAEAFVVCRTVHGIASGLHHYARSSNDLRRIGSASIAAIERAVASEASSADASRIRSADAVVVIVSAVARGCSKYGARGYTYALLDAGLMTHRVQLAGRELGLDVTPIWLFDDAAVAAALDVDGIDLCPHLVIALEGINSAGVSS